MKRSAKILHETVPGRDVACMECLETMNVSIDELPDLVSDDTTSAMLADVQHRDLLREVLPRPRGF